MVAPYVVELVTPNNGVRLFGLVLMIAFNDGVCSTYKRSTLFVVAWFVTGVLVVANSDIVIVPRTSAVVFVAGVANGIAVATPAVLTLDVLPTKYCRFCASSQR